ncbi:MULTISPECIES: DUF4826 family protein [Shewanella]|uniref:DUF4826 family protein n=1 Tax=Shewanella japonica TaxID=93973 RepID=A0ABN4YDS1_9GAMM|nr:MULTISPECIES: DUF4826 family protein [Shewanella]ARD22576.1 hypothetical protein SJ2017_2286 [Shewanella japonica]KPZ72481.1 hypothetical protein AN944_00723 [Shewanella sp. P1-14-1]MBQ4889021.1 DUF4826 family protein [Shewanella sp. MMG014]OBT11300.1 DUF4826 domain-containing protein [Shewanella sp. UCD-FRSSP16_17]
MTESVAEPKTEQQDPEVLRQQWVQAQFQKANRFLAEKGVIPSKVLADESRYLVPYLAIWKMESKQPTKQTFWVMSGDLPSDYVDVKVAGTAREAIRHFSMMWQIKAENLHKSGATRDETQLKFANLLVSRAESLYNMQNDEKLWQDQA